MTEQGDVPAIAHVAPSPAPVARPKFTGTRRQLFGLYWRSAFLSVPTIGLYRFWYVTEKRHFYWSNTEIDSDALEYSGTARQLLVGFAIAVVIFVPLYAGLFFLSVQAPDLALIGYGVAGVLLYYLAGFALYRSRRFRLTRTFWRGIRFHQSGSGLGYASRRFGWSLLMVVTLGLVYPFMSTSLCRYRFIHTWFGDRRFEFSGKARDLAGPFYRAYFAVVILAVATSIVGGVSAGKASLLILVCTAISTIAAFVGYFYFRSREASRQLSAIKIGEATLKVTVRARTLIAQHLLYWLLMAVATIVLGLIVAFIIGFVYGDSLGKSAGNLSSLDVARLMRLGSLNLIGIIGVWLVFLGIYGAIGELILSFGYWKAVARGAEITDVLSLRSVRASGAESAIVGEGLADALNVGAY